MIRWVDGGEMWGDGTYLNRAYVNASGVTIGTPGRVAPGLRSINFNGGNLKSPSLGAANNWTIGFGFKATAVTVVKVQIFAGAAEQCRLELETDGGTGAQWKLIRGTTTIATSPAFALNQWFYFELQVDVLTSAAAYELRQNEVNVMSGTGANLADSGTGGADAFGIDAVGTPKFDDIYVLDNDNTDLAGNTTFRGDSVEFEALITANGHQQDFTPSTGASNVLVVDDLATAASSSDYVSSDTNTNQDFYEFEDLPSTGIGTIYAVKLSASVAMEGIGSRTFKYKFSRADNTEFDVGDTQAVSGVTLVDLPVFVAINPDTVAAWTKTALDAGEFGIEVVS